MSRFPQVTNSDVVLSLHLYSKSIPRGKENQRSTQISKSDLDS